MFNPKEYPNVSAKHYTKRFKLTMSPDAKELLKFQLLLFAAAMASSFLLTTYANTYVAGGYLMLAVVCCAVGVLTTSLSLTGYHQWITGFTLLAGIMAVGLITLDFNWIWGLAVCCFYLPSALSLMLEGIREWPKPEARYLMGLYPAHQTKQLAVLGGNEGYAAIRFNLVLANKEPCSIAYPIDWVVTRELSWRAILSVFVQYAHSRGQGISTDVFNDLATGTYTLTYRNWIGRKRYLSAEDCPDRSTCPVIPRIKIRSIRRMDIHFVRTVTLTLENK